MSRNFFDDLLDVQNLLYRFRSIFLGGSWKGPSSIKDKQAITPPPRPGAPAQGQGPQRPGAAQGRAPQRPGMSPQDQAPQRPGMPPQSPPLGQNQNQTPSTPVESLADQQMKLIKARGMNYLNNSVSMWVNQFYSKAKAYFERRS